MVALNRSILNRISYHATVETFNATEEHSENHMYMLSYFSPHNKTSELSYFFQRKRKVIEPFTQHLLRFHHYQGAQGQNDFMCESLRLKRQVLDNVVVTVFLQSGFSFYITKA